MPKIETDIDACEVILHAGAGDQRPCRGEGLGGAGKHHRPRARAPGAHREDEKIRFRDVQAQPRKIISSPDLERHRERDRQLQRRLHQRPRADPLAHADRPPAVLPGPPLDDRLRRGLVQLPPAGGPEDHPPHAGIKQRQPRDPAELHHAAPEVGHPLHLHRQPDDADAVRGGPIVWLSARRRRSAAGIVDNDWIELFNVNGAIAARAVVSQRVNPGMVHDVPRPGEDREHARIGDHRRARRHPQLGDAHRAQAHPHDRRLRAAVLRLQLLRARSAPTATSSSSCARWQGRLAGRARGRRPHEACQSDEPRRRQDESHAHRSAWC
jgi:nitrate reductase alpha subunit